MNGVHRAGFAGTGNISAYHAAAVRRIPSAELVAVYDVDANRAERAAREYGARSVESIEAFARQGVDVVHVLTPPDSHAEIALQALDAGMHVIVEKPLATSVEDCRRIRDLADRKGLRVCVDHSLLYDPQIKNAIDTVRSGKIGRLVSVHSVRSSDYPQYVGGPLPPHYRSAGYPFRDLGVHQLYVLQALLGPIREVRARWSSFGGDPNLTFDEWDADVLCRDADAHVTISFNARPIASMLLLQGTKGVLCVDQMRMFTTLRSDLPIPKAVERIVSTYAQSLRSMLQAGTGAAAFAAGKVRQFHGVQELVAEFYRTLDADLPVPVSIADAIPVVDWVERIARAADADAAQRAGSMPALAPEVPVLVTGAAGALGSAIVARLREQGIAVRVFVRSNAREIPAGVEIVRGDLGDPDAVDKAVRGARVVIHAGAATKGGWIAQRASTVVGTNNVVESCLRHGVEQLVYVSSLSVVKWAETNGEPLSESSALEPFPEARGAYTRAKLEAELVVRAAVRERRLPAVILRPGQIFGGRLPLVNAAVARRVGKRRIVLGNGALRLPLVYLDDVVDAVAAAMEKRLVDGQIVHLVDGDLPTQNDILRRAGTRYARVVHIPRWLVFTGGWFSEFAFRMLGRSSPLSVYRLRSALAQRTFRSESANRVLGWKPRVGVLEGIERVRGVP